MAKHGDNIIVMDNDQGVWKFDHIHIDLHMSGALVIYNSNGQRIKTFGPSGWKYYEPYTPLEKENNNGNYNGGNYDAFV